MDKNNVDTAKELPTVISFCSGYGGIERGLDLAGVKHRVLAYVEIEAFAIANLVNKMENGLIPPAPIYTDLKTFPAHIFRGCVDILTGGYPCQPFSAAGKRLGTEDPRHLWPYILDHINAIRPVRCFFENVEGHISLGLREVIDDLEGAGYSATWGIFSAAEVGAPHQRKRVYILADSKSGEPWQQAQRQGDVESKKISEGLRIRKGRTAQPQRAVCKRTMWPTPATRDHHAQGLSHNPASRSSSLATVIQRENAAQTWLTPTVQDSKHSGTNPGPNGKRDLLVNQVNWQTPVANDSVERAKGNYNSRGEPKLSAQVKNWPTPNTWPTVRVSSANGASQKELQAGNPKRRLETEVLLHPWPTPSAHEARLGYQDQSDPTKKGRQECTGHLNPAWVSWLMGIPADWTDLGDWE
jgi:site-specific DNA-cytosine methylase